MISPRLRAARMTARAARMMFIMYVVRNILGTVAFGWMVALGIQVGGVLAYIFPLLALGYVGTAIFNGNKLYKQYRGIAAREQQGTRTPPSNLSGSDVNAAS